MNMNQIRHDLKPCPFCGSIKSLTTDSLSKSKRYPRVKCQSYLCDIEGPNRRTKKLAIEAWNNRSGIERRKK